MNKSKSKEMKELLSEKGRRYNCKECGKQMANKRSFYTHNRAAHQGVKYPCRQCLYQATTKGYLDQHRKSVHEGMKYPCGQYAYLDVFLRYLVLTLPTRIFHPFMN